MFMTFKASARPRGVAGNGQGDRQGGKSREGSMRQVAASDASHGTSRNRFGASRRPACTRCQVKKLRCTGLGDSCDRCRQHDTACITEPTSRQRGRKKAIASGAAGSKAATALEEDDKPVSWPRSLSTNDANLSPRHPPNTEPSQMSSHGSHPGSPIISLPRISEMFDAADDASWQKQRESRSVPSARESNSSDGPRPSCACIEDALDLVQKLDDDHFRLGMITSDQVLQVHKLLVSQCLRSLDCPRCCDESAAHTVILILCDRATQMMTALAGRLERSTAGRQISEDRRRRSTSGDVAPYQSPTGHRTFEVQPLRHSPGRPGSRSDSIEEEGWRRFQQPSPTSSSPVSNRPSETSSDSGRVPGLCGESGGGMFTPEFRAQYSDEELFHMIRELAWIQIRNMHRLLGRVEALPPTKRNLARADRIQTLRQKVEEAAGRMDRWFEAMLAKLGS